MMLIAFYILHLTYFPWPSAEAIWTRPVKKTSGRDELSGFANPENELIPRGFEDIFSDHAALAQTIRKPDCFRQEISRMQHQCADLDELEEEKISFAISMTLCELEIAHLSPPMECRQKSTITPTKRRHCVEALARSAQSWSSYSGYFRESTRICYAYQQLNDVDIAKNIYQNITGEKMRLMRFLLGREKTFQRNDQQLSASIESMQEILSDLRGSTGVFDSIASNATDLVTDLSNDILKHVTTNLEEALILASRHQTEWQAHALLEVDMGVSSLLAGHAEFLENTTKGLGNALLNHAETLLQRVHLHDQELSRIMSQINGQWNEVMGGVSTLHLSISQASRAVNQMDEQLQAHRDEIAVSHAVQSVVTKKAEQLASALENMTSATQAELVQIKNATHSIRENLIAPPVRETRIWYSLLLGVFRITGRGDLHDYHQISEHVIFRILITVGRLVLSSAWFLLSATMRIVVPVEALVFQAKEVLKKPRLNTPL